LEICSREFENEVKRLLTKAPHVRVCEKLLQLIKKWSDMNEFREDQQLNLIPTLYRSLKSEGFKFTSSEANGSSSKKHQKLPSDPNVVTSNQEEEDIAKAIQESLKLTSGPGHGHVDNGYGSSNNNSNHKSSASSSVYPSFDPELMNGTSHRNPDSRSSAGPVSSSAVKETYQVRALYDFEAAEDNELTFKTGEIVVVIDDR
jgi:signal transducing adaptor molecule